MAEPRQSAHFHRPLAWLHADCVNSKVYEGDPFKLTVSPEEIQGFVEEIREACPAWDITREDVAVVNAGLLPIGEGEQGQKGLSLGKRSPLIDHATRGGPTA